SDETRAWADLDPAFEQAQRAYLDAVGQLDLRADHCRRMNPRRSLAGVAFSHERTIWTRLMEQLRLRRIVGMFLVVDFAARDPILLVGPGSEIDHVAALGAKRPELVILRHVRRLLADRTTHRSFETCQIAAAGATPRVAPSSRRRSLHTAVRKVL